MARLTVIIGLDPHLLLEAAADGFLTPLRATAENPFPSPRYLLALRQGGLRDDLIALAAARGVAGWFDPPLCVFHELPKWLGATARAPCGDFERAALLASVVRRVSGQVFGSLRRIGDFLGALERYLGELACEGVTPDEYATATDRLEHPDEFERMRDGELVTVYRLYCGELERAGLRDKRATYIDCARAVREDPEGLARRLSGRREIRFFGLHDLRGGWRSLLRALVDSLALDRVVIYASQSLGLGLDLEVEEIGVEAPESIAARLFIPAARSGGRFDVVEAPNVERELGEVARRVRGLVDAEVPLSRIAVVTRQARPHVDLALRALARFGVPATARRRFSYGEIPVVRAVLALFAAAADGWSRRTLVELAGQPYFRDHLDAGVLNFVGYRRMIRGIDAWQDALQSLEQESIEFEKGGEENWRQRRPPRSGRLAAARKTFTEFADLVTQLDHSHSLDDWIRWLMDLVETDPLRIQDRIYDVPAERFDIAKRDLAGWRGLKQILGEWKEAIERWGGAGERLTVAGFYGRLREMLAGDVALWTETLRGVQVLEGLAAAYRSFDHLFLVGMEAGRFPLPPFRSPILDNSSRVALCKVGLALDVHRDWEARERGLFRTLVAGAKNLTVSYARLDVTGRETIRSAFIEALTDVAAGRDVVVDDALVLTPGAPLYHCAEVAAHAEHVARIERQRESGALSPYNGGIGDPELVSWLERQFGDDRQWSPTQLEAYAKCPWAYFSARVLRLEKLDEPDEEMAATTRGSIFHDALARFFERAGERVGGPVFLRQPDIEWAEPLLFDALDASLEEFARTTWLGHPVLRSTERGEMQRVMSRYLRWEIQHNEDMYNMRKRYAPLVLRTGVQQHEQKFEGIVLERGGVRFKFRGSIDRVEAGVDERIDSPESFVAAVDYKTSEAGTPGGGDEAAWDDDVVLQVPLYAYALTQLSPGTRVSRVEYRALLQRKQVHSLELQQVDKRTEVRFANKDAVAKMERALDAVAKHVLRTRSGEFPAAPAPSCMCPPFCHGWDICRVVGGPVKKKERR